MLRFTLRRLQVTSERLLSKLRATAVLAPTSLKVEDLSSGCGSFFKVSVESAAFSGKPLLEQHRMVNEALKEELNELHGITIVTSVPQLRQWAPITASDASQRTSNPIRKITDGKRVTKSTKPFIALSIGDPTVDGNLLPPTTAQNAIVKAIHSNKYNGYPMTIGIAPARAAVAKFFSQWAPSLETPITADDVILSSGASHAIELTLGALCNPGDNVLLPAPGFTQYGVISNNKQIVNKFYHCKPGANWEADLDEMRSLVDSRTKAILINNPSNPCGSNFTRQHVTDILRLAEELKIPVVSDEIYAGMVWEGETFTSVADVKCDVPRIILGGVSKAFVAPGWRMGWIIRVDPKKCLNNFMAGAAALTTLIVGPGALIQGAMTEFLQGTPADYFKTLIKTLSDNSNYFYTRFNKIPGLRASRPQGAMYFVFEIDFSKFDGMKTDIDFMNLLFEEENILVLPGCIFRAENMIRLVTTRPQAMNKEAIDRIEAFCARHYKH